MRRFGDWAVVTGANSGLGADFARILATDGYSVVLVGRRQFALDDVAATLPTATRVVTCDLSRDGAAAQIAAACEGLDVGLLISNAGEIMMGSVLSTPLDALKASLHLNAGAHLELVHWFGTRFVARGGGGILLTSTLGALQATPWSANYAAAKSYTLNLGLALNHELRNTGVHVSVVLPGPMRTPGLTGKGTVPIISSAPTLAAEKVAAAALAALEKNQPFIVPGATNKIMGALSALLGRRRSRNLFARLMRSVVPVEHRANAGID